MKNWKIINEPIILPGSRIRIIKAVEKSMLIPISDTQETKYKQAVIAKCTAIEEPIEPRQFVVETCNYYHKFKVTEVISGTIDSEFVCNYTIYIPNNEQVISKGESYILILQESKAEGQYTLAKALYDNRNNRKEIKLSIEKLSYLIN